jgi:hypothetical protein
VDRLQFVRDGLVEQLDAFLVHGSNEGEGFVRSTPRLRRTGGLVNDPKIRG